MNVNNSEDIANSRDNSITTDNWNISGRTLQLAMFSRLLTFLASPLLFWKTPGGTWSNRTIWPCPV
jgi:hypothetical protein